MGVGTDLYMYVVVVKVHVRYLISMMSSCGYYICKLQKAEAQGPKGRELGVFLGRGRIGGSESVSTS